MIWGILVEIGLFLLIAYVPFIQMFFHNGTTITSTCFIAAMSSCPDPFGGTPEVD